MEPSLSLTPLTSVSKSNLSAFNAAAIAPDTVSPFIFKVSPSMPEPSGAITGIMSFSNKLKITSGLTSLGVPTRPNSGLS